MRGDLPKVFANKIDKKIIIHKIFITKIIIEVVD